MEKQNPLSTGSASTFVKCIGCSKLIRLPADPDPDVMGRCPRCGETFQIGVLLDAEIPELEVLGQSASPVPSIVSFEPKSDKKRTEPIPKDEQNRFVVAPALAKGAKRKKKRRRSRSSSESESSSSKKATAQKPQQSERKSSSGSSRSSRSSSSRSSSSRSSSSRSRRPAPEKPDSGLVEGIKILLGALLAPPVAQLVIWWVLGLDPLGMGPTVSKFVPMVVPAKFHAESSEEPKAEPVETSKKEKFDPSDPYGGPLIKEDILPAPRDFPN